MEDGQLLIMARRLWRHEFGASSYRRQLSVVVGNQRDLQRLSPSSQARMVVEIQCVPNSPGRDELRLLTRSRLRFVRRAGLWRRRRYGTHLLLHHSSRRPFDLVGQHCLCRHGRWTRNAIQESSDQRLLWTSERVVAMRLIRPSPVL